MNRVNMTATRTEAKRRPVEKKGLAALQSAAAPAPEATPEPEQGLLTAAVAELEATQTRDEINQVMNRHINTMPDEEYTQLADAANQRWASLGEPNDD